MLKEEADTTNWIKVVKQLFFTFFNNLFILSNSLGTFSLFLEWVAMSSSRGSSQPRDQTQVSCTAGGFFTTSATWKA